MNLEEEDYRAALLFGIGLFVTKIPNIDKLIEDGVTLEDVKDDIFVPSRLDITLLEWLKESLSVLVWSSKNDTLSMDFDSFTMIELEGVVSEDEFDRVLSPIFELKFSEVSMLYTETLSILKSESDIHDPILEKASYVGISHYYNDAFPILIKEQQIVSPQTLSEKKMSYFEWCDAFSNMMENTYIQPVIKNGEYFISRATSTEVGELLSPNENFTFYKVSEDFQGLLEEFSQIDSNREMDKYKEFLSAHATTLTIEEAFLFIEALPFYATFGFNTIQYLEE